MAEDKRGGAGGALAWLAHPLTVAATTVLVVNDHLLKGLFPGWVTGKLSDVTGLVMAPALVAALFTLLAPALRGTVAARCSILAVGVGFAMVKGTQVGADVASVAWSVLSGPSIVLADPTDLLALPALGVAWWTWRRVQGRPAPDRVVRLVRVCVILPAAALATMATSASMPPPEATFVGTVAGQAVVETFDGRFATVDGTTWDSIGSGQRVDSGVPQACLPDLSTRCYRVVAGRLAVDQSDDGMVSWTRAWEISEGRRDFLIRGYEKDEDLSYMDLTPIEGRLTSRALVVVGTGEHHVVVVANGPDGYLVRDGEGSWRRIGFLGLETGREAPLAVTAPLQRISPEYVVGLAVIAALFSIAVEVARRRRGWVAWVDKVAQSFVALGLAAAALAGTAEGLLVFAALFALPGLVAWLVLLLVRPSLSARQVACILPPVLLTGVAVAAPFVGWSSGWPDDHRTASMWAVAGGGALAAVALAVAWRSRRWVQDEPEPVLSWPPVDSVLPPVRTMSSGEPPAPAANT